MAAEVEKELAQCLAFAYFAHNPNGWDNAPDPSDVTFIKKRGPKGEKLENEHLRKYLNMFSNGEFNRIKGNLSQSFKQYVAKRAFTGKAEIAKKTYFVAKSAIEKKFFGSFASRLIVFEFLDQGDDFLKKIKDGILTKIMKDFGLPSSMKLDIFSAVDIIAVRKSKREEILNRFDKVLKEDYNLSPNEYNDIVGEYMNKNFLYPISLKLPETLSVNHYFKRIQHKPVKLNKIPIDPYIKFLDVLLDKPSGQSILINKLIGINYNDWTHGRLLNWIFPFTFNYHLIKDESGQQILDHKLVFDLFGQGRGAGWNGMWGKETVKARHEATPYVGGMSAESFWYFMKRYHEFSKIKSDLSAIKQRSLFVISMKTLVSKVKLFYMELNNEKLRLEFEIAEWNRMTAKIGSLTDELRIIKKIPINKKTLPQIIQQKSVDIANKQLEIDQQIKSRIPYHEKKNGNIIRLASINKVLAVKIGIIAKGILDGLTQYKTLNTLFGTDELITVGDCKTKIEKYFVYLNELSFLMTNAGKIVTRNSPPDNVQKIRNQIFNLKKAQIYKDGKMIEKQLRDSSVKKNKSTTEEDTKKYTDRISIAGEKLGLINRGIRPGNILDEDETNEAGEIKGKKNIPYSQLYGEDSTVTFEGKKVELKTALKNLSMQIDVKGSPHFNFYSLFLTTIIQSKNRNEKISTSLDYVKEIKSIKQKEYIPINFLRAHFIHAQISYFLFSGNKNTIVDYFKKRVFLTIFGIITKKSHNIFDVNRLKLEIKNLLEKSDNGKIIKTFSTPAPHYILS